VFVNQIPLVKRKEEEEEEEKKREIEIKGEKTRENRNGSS